MASAFYVPKALTQFGLVVHVICVTIYSSELHVTLNFLLKRPHVTLEWLSAPLQLKIATRSMVKN